MKITVNIVPRGQMRARHAAVNGFSRTYKDKKQAAEEEALMSLLGKHQPSEPLQGPLLLGVRAYLPIPAGKPKWFLGKPKEFQSLARCGQVRPIVKPDLDNLLKHVKDCLSMLRFWDDDRQVVGYLPSTGKYYGEVPRWEIEIVRMPEGGQ